MEERKKAIQNLKIAKGQIEGIIKMIEDERYCVDISNQIMATQALLRKINNEVLHGHIDSCVKEAVASGDPEAADVKLKEIGIVIDKLTKWLEKARRNLLL